MNYLIGAGGHASVIEDISIKNNFQLDGVFYDGDIQNLTDLDRVGTFENIESYIGNNKFMIAFGNIASRISLVNKMNEKNAKWFTLVDPTAVIGKNVTIGTGTVVMPGAVINAGAKIGNHVIINSGAVVEHGCIIEDYVHISPRSVVCGNSIVRAGAWIGAGAVVINEIEIGANTVVGAGAVVVDSVLPDVKVVGNPAKQILKR